MAKAIIRLAGRVERQREGLKDELAQKGQFPEKKPLE